MAKIKERKIEWHLIRNELTNCVIHLFLIQGYSVGLKHAGLWFKKYNTQKATSDV